MTEINCTFVTLQKYFYDMCANSLNGLSKSSSGFMEIYFLYSDKYNTSEYNITFNGYDTPNLKRSHIINLTFDINDNPEYIEKTIKSNIYKILLETKRSFLEEFAHNDDSYDRYPKFIQVVNQYESIIKRL